MVQQQRATTKRSKKNNKMLLEKWQENEQHLWEKGYKSTKLNKWNYQWYALKKEKPYNHPPFPPKRKKAVFTQHQIYFPSLIIVLLIWQITENQALLTRIYEEPPIISCKENHNLSAPDHAIEERLAYTRQSRKTPGKLWERLELLKFVEGVNRYWGYMKEDRHSYIGKFCSCEKKAWKTFRLVRDSNPYEYIFIYS